MIYILNVQKVSIIRKYQKHKLQTNPPHCEEELQDTYRNKTSKDDCVGTYYK